MLIFLVIIALSALIIAHELGHFLTAKYFGVKVEEFGFGFPPRLGSIRKGETRYSLNLLPFGGFVKITGENAEDEAARDPRSFVRQSTGRRLVMVLAGITMNIILAWVIWSALFLFGTQNHLIIQNIAPNAPAARAGIRANDIVLEARTPEHALSDPVSPEALIQLVRERPEVPVTLTIRRGSEIKIITVTPRAAPPEGEGPLGVSLAESGIPRLPFPQNIITAGIQTAQYFVIIGVSTLSLLASVFVRPEVINQVTGPVGIVTMTLEAGGMGIPYLAHLIAIISLNLAFLNLLPLPALDGGRALMLLVEKVRRKPVRAKTQLVVNSLGFIALLVLMVIVTVKDVTSLVH